MLPVTPEHQSSDAEREQRDASQRRELTIPAAYY